VWFLHQNVAATTRRRINMSESAIWWAAAGTVIAVELVTGTFYLLMISIGLIAAAIAAYAGATVTAQWVVAAVVGGGAVVAWRSYKKSQPAEAPANANRNVNLDVGETVHVDFWAQDGTGTVKYRGAQWDVALMPGEIAAAGSYTIVEVVGSRLFVRKA
jgi:membrane protein implicated in regulation of membrane protease activity